MQKIRGEKISAIFQEPMSSLNPLHTIDKQISEILITHSSISKKEAEAKTSELLNEVGLKEIANRPKTYSYELSGGQRQQVAVGRAMMTKPSALMLDEPTAGVSPIVMDELFERIIEIKQTGVAVLIVEQNARQALSIADKGFVLVNGQNKITGTGVDLLSNPEVRKSFLGA